MNIKQTIVRGLFLVECVVVLGNYFFGTHGLHAIFATQQEIKKIEQAVAVEQKKLSELEYDLQIVQHDDFYAEQYAREKLAMAREDDEIYLIK